MTQYHEIESFWATHDYLAFFGLSRSKAFPNQAYKAIVEAGRRVVAVHPDAPRIDGVQTYATLDEVEPLPKAAVIVTGREVAGKALECCAVHGIRDVLLQDGAWSRDNAELCTRHDMRLIRACAFLHDGDGFPHNFHRWLHKTFRP